MLIRSTPFVPSILACASLMASASALAAPMDPHDKRLKIHFSAHDIRDFELLTDGDDDSLLYSIRSCSPCVA